MVSGYQDSGEEKWGIERHLEILEAVGARWASR
jgi:hypothetical protein